MSRIGNKPIPVPGKVRAILEDGAVRVEGPKGKLSSPIPAGIRAALTNGELVFTRSSDAPDVRASHGLARALAANCISGVSEGFTKSLQISGVGYRVTVKDKDREIEFHLGYSHPINFPLPEGISAKSEQDRQTKSILLTLEGADKQVIGQVAANIRRLRPPEPYKGKGIRYKDEKILRKAGKSGK